MSQNISKRLEKAFLNYKEEAESYFVTKFLDAGKVKDTIKTALNLVLNLEGNSVKKGLMIYSKSTGQGKSLFFEIIYHRYMRVSKLKIWKNTTAKELREIYIEKGVTALNEFIRVKNLFIDDLGDEEDSTKHFGETMNVLRHVILKRYEFWVKNQWILHLTTNLSINEIALRYDRRAADRLLEMCEIIEFDFLNGSFRQVKNTRRLSKEEKKEEPEETKKFIYRDTDYCNLINEEAEIYRKTNATERHWIDFWVMYMFFERKGLKMREPNESDNEKCKKVILNEKLKAKLGYGYFKQGISQTQETNTKNENIIKSLIAWEYFTKLAKENFVFSETTDLSEL